MPELSTYLALSGLVTSVLTFGNKALPYVTWMIMTKMYPERNIIIRRNGWKGVLELIAQVPSLAPSKPPDEQQVPHDP